MPIDKLNNVGRIKDEQAKIEMIHQIQIDAGISRLLLSRIDCATASMREDAYTTVSLLKESIKTLSDGINQLTGTITDLFTKSETTAAEQDAQLTNALTSPANSASEAFIGEGGSATVETGNEPILIAIGGVEETLTKGLAANTAAIKQASKEEQQVQVNQTKALIANETKRQQAEDRNRLLNGNRNKEQVGNLPQKLPKLEMPKFPVNGKQFMAGLGKILKGILNPVALIAGVFFHLLPYIILAVSFFKGFWNKLAPALQTKVKEVATKIVFYAALAFLLFKGPALLIKTLELAWYVIRVGYAVAKWGLEIAFHALRMIFTTTEHGFRMSATMFDRMCTMIEHIAEMLSIAFENVLNLAAFVLKVAAIIFIVAAIVLLVGGVILLFALLGDKIIEGIKKIIEVFSMIGGMIYNFVIGYAKLIVDVFITLITGLYGGLIKAIVNGIKWLFGGSSEDEKKKTVSETEIKNGVTKDVFAAALKPIRESLNSLNDCVADLKALEQSKILNPVGTLFNTVATSVMRLFNGNSVINTVNADSTNSQISANYVSMQNKEDLNKTLREDVSTIAKILDKWYNDRDDNRNKAPNTVA